MDKGILADFFTENLFGIALIFVISSLIFILIFIVLLIQGIIPEEDFCRWIALGSFISIGITAITVKVLKNRKKEREKEPSEEKEELFKKHS